MGDTMDILKKNGKRIIFIGLVVFSIGVIVSLRKNAPQEPVILYKTAQPSKPQTNVKNTVSRAAHSHEDSHDYNHYHNHSHDTTLYSDAVQESSSDDAYDWRDDSAFDAPRPKTDPWKNLDVQQTDIEASIGSREDSEVYLPPNWHLTEDPELRAQYFHAQLINQFGDIPEVHTVAVYQ